MGETMTSSFPACFESLRCAVVERIIIQFKLHSQSSFGGCLDLFNIQADMCVCVMKRVGLGQGLISSPVGCFCGTETEPMPSA